jgi:hypothetical protein
MKEKSDKLFEVSYHLLSNPTDRESIKYILGEWGKVFAILGWIILAIILVVLITHGG